MALIEVRNNTKIYQTGDEKLYANKDISFSIEKGELVIIAGHDIAKYDRRELTTYRRLSVGFVFQFYNLIPNLTAKENVELASEIVPQALDAVEALKAVGLANRINNFPAQLSGGEQQRVAIARAVAKNPQLLLCDEPTGALDYETGKQVLQILQDMSREHGSTVIIVTHNAALAPIGDQVLHIHDGQLVKQERNQHPADIQSIEW